MRREEREELELEKLTAETRKLDSERHKLVVEQKKLAKESALYPFFVASALLATAAALAKLIIEPH